MRIVWIVVGLAVQPAAGCVEYTLFVLSCRTSGLTFEASGLERERERERALGG